MPPTLLRFIWLGNRKGQLVVFFVTMLALPFYYVSLELPKLIVNDVLGDGDVRFPVEVSLLGRELLALDRTSWLVVLCVAFLAAVLAQGGIKFLLNVYKARLGGQLLLNLRRLLCLRVLRLPPGGLGQVSSDELSTMIGAELTDIGAFAGEAFATPLLQGGLVLTAIVFIFVQEQWLGVAAIALIPVQLYVVPKLQMRVNSLTRDRVYAMRSLASRLREATDALPEIQASGATGAELDALQRILVKIYDIRYAITWRRSFIKLLNSFLFQLTPFFFLLVGGLFVIEGNLSLGALVAVLAAYKDLPPSARELLDFYQSYQNVRVKYEQIVAQFSPPGSESLTDDETSGQVRRRQGAAIEADSLTIDGDSDRPLVADARFTSGDGRALAIVGLDERAGTALARVLAGLQRPDAGRVRIGGMEAADLTSADRQGMILIGGQGAFFNGSLRYNLAYGVPEHEASPDRLLDCVARASLGGDLPHLGLNTLLDVDTHGEIAVEILQARSRVRDRLSGEGLIEPFEWDTFCAYTSIAENVVWGKASGLALNLDDLADFPPARRAIRRARLAQPLREIGAEIARRTIEEESADPGEHPADPPLVFPDERELLRSVFRLGEEPRLDRLPSFQSRLLQSIAMRVTPAYHPFVPVDAELADRILVARRVFANALPAWARAQIEPFDRRKYNRGLTLRENLLFGVVKDTSAVATQRLENELLGLVAEMGLTETVTRAGLEFTVGLHGHRLSTAQRTKAELARLLIRAPELAIVHCATGHLDEQDVSKVVSNVVSDMRGRSLVWILDRPSHARHFDSVLVFEHGRLLGDRSPSTFEIVGRPVHAERSGNPGE